MGDPLIYGHIPYIVLCREKKIQLFQKIYINNQYNVRFTWIIDNKLHGIKNSKVQ